MADILFMRMISQASLAAVKKPIVEVELLKSKMCTFICELTNITITVM